MTNRWLEGQGLASLKSLWAPLAPRCFLQRGLNRLVRTCMPGGVWRAVRNGCPNPISLRFTAHSAPMTSISSLRATR